MSSKFLFMSPTNDKPDLSISRSCSIVSGSRFIDLSFSSAISTFIRYKISGNFIQIRQMSSEQATLPAFEEESVMMSGSGVIPRASEV